MSKLPRFSWSLARETEILIIILVAWVSFKALWFAPRFSDGNIYIYLGHLVAQGVVPYKDFFYSSPPLLLYISAMWGQLFGFTWQAFNWLPLVATVAEASILYYLAKSFWSGWAAIVGVCLYLTSVVVLGTTDFASDIHIVNLLCTAALALALKDKPRLSGLLLALAMLTKVYAGVVLIILIAWYVWQKRWVALANFAAVWALVLLVVNGLWWGIIGQPYIQQVFLNNLHRGLGIAKGPLWHFMVTRDFVLLGGLLLAIYFWRRVPSWLWLGLIILPVFYAIYPDIYFLYFKLWAVYLALAWSFGVYQLTLRWPDIKLKYLIGALVIVSMLGVSGLYTQTEAKTGIIDNLTGMVSYVQQVTDQHDTLYGDFTIAPLLSLQSGRPLVDNLVDTNIKFFNQGIFSYKDRAAQLAAAHVPLIITIGVVGQSDAGLTLTGGSVDQTILQRCEVDQVFPIKQDYEANAVIFWRCL